MIILPIVFWDVPYSAFDLESGNRKAVEEQLLLKNRLRYRSSMKYMKKLNQISNLTKHEPCELSVGVVTVSRMFDRHVLGYLTQVMHHLHREALHTNTCLSICNVHAGPGNHSEANALSPYFHSYVRFPVQSASHVIMDVFEREKEDYSFCLERLLEHNTDKILLLEDDAVPINNFFSVLLDTLSALTERDPNWGYVKMFYPPRWQGFSFELSSVKELCIIGILGAVLFIQIYVVIAWIRKPEHGFLHKLLCRETVVALVCGFVYATCIAMCVGHQNILHMYRDLGYYYTVPAPDCCSPAILYKRNVTEMLVEHFRNTQCNPHYPLDKALDSFRLSHGIDAYLTEPSLVWHIGLVSTLKGISRHLEEYLYYE